MSVSFCRLLLRIYPQHHQCRYMGLMLHLLVVMLMQVHSSQMLLDSNTTMLSPKSINWLAKLHANICQNLQTQVPKQACVAPSFTDHCQGVADVGQWKDDCCLMNFRIVVRSAKCALAARQRTLSHLCCNWRCMKLLAAACCCSGVASAGI